jgi:hypothetical protein
MPFDAERCHELSVSRTAETTPFHAQNASERVKLPDTRLCMGEPVAPQKQRSGQALARRQTREIALAVGSDLDPKRGFSRQPKQSLTARVLLPTAMVPYFTR